MERRKRTIMSTPARGLFLAVAISASLAGRNQVSAADDDVAAGGLDPTKVMGARACLNCHPSESLALIHSAHSAAHLKLRGASANKYAKALGLKKPASESKACDQCHATPRTSFTGSVQVISGVSCESCHGESGGEDGWLNAHAVYGPNGSTPESETEEHRATRLKRIDKAGMVRSNHIAKLANKCFGCHSVTNAALVNAGHKTGGGFEFVGRSIGEVRHNFHIDQSNNADEPSLWASRYDGDAAARRRIKFIVGILTDAQIAFATLSSIEDEEVLDSDFPELVLERAEPPLEYLEVSIEVLEDDVPEQLETALEIIEEGLDADFAEEEGREALAEAAEGLDELVKWFAAQDGKNLEALDEVLEEFVEAKGTPYERK